MKILITGGSGFIGRSLIKALNQEHDVFSPSSKELDVTNSYDVEKYLQNKYFDWVIHCAIKGGRRATQDTSDDAYNNIKMFFNLMNNKVRFGKLINFSSGAQFSFFCLSIFSEKSRQSDLSSLVRLLATSEFKT